MVETSEKCVHAVLASPCEIVPHNFSYVLEEKKMFSSLLHHELIFFPTVGLSVSGCIVCC